MTKIRRSGQEKGTETDSTGNMKQQRKYETDYDVISQKNNVSLASDIFPPCQYDTEVSTFQTRFHLKPPNVIEQVRNSRAEEEVQSFKDRRNQVKSYCTSVSICW